MNNIDFEEIKKIIIPYFIEFYGEKYKDVIVERINKIIPIFYSKIENQKTEKNIKLEEEKIKLTLKFLNFLNINISEELKKKIILERSLISILNSENEQITNILKFYFGSKTYSKDRYFGIDKLVLKETDDKKIKKSNIEKLELLKIGVNEENYNEWVIGKEAEKLKEEIEKVKHFLITLDQEYDDFEKEYVNLNERIDKFDEVKRMLEQKYILLFLGEIKEFLPEQDKILLIKYLKSYKKDWYSLISNLNILKIVGSSFNIDGLIKSFGKEATEKLNNPKISKFQKNNILNDRIDYYKLIGIYNEKVSLEDFMNSKEAIENTPTSSFVDKITAIKEKYNKLFQNELLEMTSTYRTDMNTLNNLN